VALADLRQRIAAAEPTRLDEQLADLDLKIARALDLTIELGDLDEAKDRLRSLRAERARKGDVVAARVILERTDPALRRQELSGVEGKPLEIDARAVARVLTKEDLLEIRALAKQLAARSEARASGGQLQHQDDTEAAAEYSSASRSGSG